VAAAKKIAATRDTMFGKISAAMIRTARSPENCAAVTKSSLRRLMTRLRTTRPPNAHVISTITKTIVQMPPPLR
jgi:hypothetical protein